MTAIRNNALKNARGVSLVELMIVVAILGILVFVLQDSYSRWSRRYRVESEAKLLHSYLLDARGRAMARYRAHFVVTTGNGYVVAEDTDPAPDGNGSYVGGADNVVHVATVAAPYTVENHVSGVDATHPLTFGRDGTASGSGYILIGNTAEISGDFTNCVDVAPTRIRVGMFNGTTCQPR